MRRVCHVGRHLITTHTIATTRPLSVYMDNPSLDAYHSRLRRDDGARAIRLRW